jgi:capsular polysaccharide biosynthesis protein
MHVGRPVGGRRGTMSSNLPAERNSGESQALPAAGGAAALPAVPAAAMAMEAFAPEETGGGMNPRRMLSTLMRYKWLILVCTVAGGALGIVATKLQGPVYQAQATIWIELGASRNGPITETSLTTSFNWGDLLKSFTVLDSVVKEQRLFIIPKTADDNLALATFNVKDVFQSGSYQLTVSPDGHSWTLNLEDGQVVDQGRVGDSVGTGLGFLWQPAPALLTRKKTVSFSVVPPRQAALNVSSALTVKVPLLNGNFMSLTYDASSPTRAAKTLNSLVDQFVHVAAELKSMKLHEQTRILDLQLQSAKQELDRAESALENFKVTTITEPRDEAPPIAAGLASTQPQALQNFFSMKTQQDDLRRDRMAVERGGGRPPPTWGFSPTLSTLFPR